MTDKEKRELKDSVISIFKRFNILDHTATIGSLRDNILRYIDSLQKEPVSEDLEEAVDEYAPDFSNSIASKAAVDAVRNAFKTGAKWKEQQMMAKAIDAKVIINGMGNPILHLWDKGRYLIDKKVKKVILIKED